ncbi:hypothetical protein DI383_03610 [Flavobacteriaceae bacterium LYZ1037]|nr:hypothetical protein DI383_03610 [Flavobacteriaceae bacterium LYZ1037]
MGFYRRKNNIIIPFEYKLIRNFHEGLAVVKVEGKLAFINIKNEIVIKPKFKYYYSSGFYEGLSLVRSDEGKFGYIDKQGNIIIETIYDYATKFNNGFSVVGLDNLYGLINREGVVVLPIKHTSLIDYENTNYKFTE